MTVLWSSGLLRSPKITDIAKQGKERNAVCAYPAKGLQVAATLFALRLGYKLAKTAVGRLFPEPKATARDGEGQQEEIVGDEGAAPGSDLDGSAVAARDQWVISTQPAPDTPDGSKLVASEHLPISVYHFYEQFLSIEATCLQDHHKSTGQYNFRYSRWKSNGDGSFSRQFDFMQPKKGVCSVNAHCIQEQRFTVHAGGVFVMTTDMYMEQIPYADCFRVQSFWRAEPDATGMGTNVSIHVAVPFTKRCLMKGLINSTTMGDCRSFFGDFLSKVQNSITNELLPTAAAAAVAAEQLLGTSPDAGGSGGSMASPFATADAEVFINSTPGLSSYSSGNSSAPIGGRGRPHQQQQQQLHGQKLMTKGSSPLSKRSQQQQQHVAAAEAERLLSRSVSSKPSFAQPISELRLAGRSNGRVVLGSMQTIVLLLVLFVQLLTLYDNMTLHGKLAAASIPC